jgi:bifunctional DNA-binding transcriptional regulator/antitoxin component of YhaV-PrlF toxin-antitoxin module
MEERAKASVARAFDIRKTHDIMQIMSDKTTVTDRGQTTIPARLRHQHHVEAGTQLVWDPIGPDEFRVRIERKPGRTPDPLAMLGYARNFREVRATADWMRDLREGEGEGEE